MADLKKEILKKLGRFQYSRGRREVFLDAVEHMALTIATKFDPLKQEERADRIATRGASRPNSGDSIKL